MFSLLTAPHCSLSFCSQVLIVDLCADKFVVQVCTQRLVLAGNERCGSRSPCLHLSPLPSVCVRACISACVCVIERLDGDTLVWLHTCRGDECRTPTPLGDAKPTNQRVEPLEEDWRLCLPVVSERWPPFQLPVSPPCRRYQLPCRNAL